MSDLRLLSVSRDPADFAARAADLLQAGARSLAILPDDGFAAAIRAGLPPHRTAGATEADIVCLTHADAAALDAALLDQIDRGAGSVVIPSLPGHGPDRPLFLISIPKSGTHLLYRLAEALGFRPGIVCPDEPSPGYWYCVEYSNSHTVPRDFFVDTVRRAPFGNRHHPFLSSPALFITRHPLDILVSEASYYGRAGNAAFAGWYQGLDFTASVARLVDDDVLLGRFADRVMAFSPWMAFPNVLTLGFEDIVGAEGGGDPSVQRALIWSIQVRLALPGDPADVAARLFDRNSPTFRDGRIGSHLTAFRGAELEAKAALAARPLAAFGYRADGTLRSADAETWRRRPVRVSGAAFDDVPILIEPNFLGHNLVRYRRWFYAVPGERGNEDLRRMPAEALAELPNAQHLDALRATLIRLPGLAVQQSMFERRDADHQALVRSLEERTVRLQGLEAAMAERTRRLEGLERSATLAVERVAALESALAERSQRLAGLEQAIAERTQRLKGLEGAMGERTLRITGLEAAGSQSLTRLTSLEAALGERTSRLEALEDRTASAAPRLADLADRLAALERDARAHAMAGDLPRRLAARLADAEAVASEAMRELAALRRERLAAAQEAARAGAAAAQQELAAAAAAVAHRRSASLQAIESRLNVLTAAFKSAQ